MGRLGRTITHINNRDVGNTFSAVGRSVRTITRQLIVISAGARRVCVEGSTVRAFGGVGSLVISTRRRVNKLVSSVKGMKSTLGMNNTSLRAVGFTMSRLERNVRLCILLATADGTERFMGNIALTFGRRTTTRKMMRQVTTSTKHRVVIRRGTVASTIGRRAATVIGNGGRLTGGIGLTGSLIVTRDGHTRGETMEVNTNIADGCNGVTGRTKMCATTTTRGMTTRGTITSTTCEAATTCKMRRTTMEGGVITSTRTNCIVRHTRGGGDTTTTGAATTLGMRRTRCTVMNTTTASAKIITGETVASRLNVVTGIAEKVGKVATTMCTLSNK